MNDQVSRIVDSVERADPVLGGAAPVVAIVLLIATALLVSREERPRAKTSVLFLLAYLLLVGVLSLTPRDSPTEGTIRLIATMMILASIARSTFLLFVHSFWMRKFARPVPKILRDVTQGVIFVIAFLVVLRSVGVELGSILTTSALLTAVIGLSLQDTLGNLFAGLAIQAQRPFSVGDWVQVNGEAGEIGRVVEINWRATRVVTLARLEVTLPNAAVAKSSIVNFSRPTRLVRREVEVQAPYEAAPEYIRKVLLTGMSHVQEVLTTPAPQVFTKAFSERGVTYAVRYFITEFQDRELIESLVHDRMWYALNRADVRIPVPRRQIELKQVAAAPADESKHQFDSTRRLLSQLPLFESLPGDSLDKLIQQCRRRRYASEEVIVHKGESSTEMYIVESGRVRIEVTDGSNEEPQVVGFLERGEFFGEMSLMTGEARTADVIATRETTVLGLDRDSMQPVLEQHPELAEHMSRILAERQVRLDDVRSIAPQIHEDGETEESRILQRIRRFFGN